MSPISGPLRTLGAVALGIMAMAITPPASAATSIYSEDFADGLGTFTASGSVTTGTYGARLRGSSLSGPSMTSAPIDLTGHNDVTVSYTRAASGLDLGETFTAAYSLDGGSFTPLESARTATGAASFRLPASVEGRDLRLRFSLAASSILETLTVDDVRVEAADGQEPP